VNPSQNSSGNVYLDSVLWIILRWHPESLPSWPWLSNSRH
jgi:hypothetical protein